MRWTPPCTKPLALWTRLGTLCFSLQTSLFHSQHVIGFCHVMFFSVFSSFWCWALNPGLQVCWASALPLSHSGRPPSPSKFQFVLGPWPTVPHTLLAPDITYRVNSLCVHQFSILLREARRQSFTSMRRQKQGEGRDRCGSS